MFLFCTRKCRRILEFLQFEQSGPHPPSDAGGSPLPNVTRSSTMYKYQSYANYFILRMSEDAHPFVAAVQRIRGNARAHDTASSALQVFDRRTATRPVRRAGSVPTVAGNEGSGAAGAISMIMISRRRPRGNRPPEWGSDRRQTSAAAVQTGGRPPPPL